LPDVSDQHERRPLRMLECSTFGLGTVSAGRWLGECQTARGLCCVVYLCVGA
jgi:hypothetical protein